MALIYRAFFAMQRTPGSIPKVEPFCHPGFANTLYELLRMKSPPTLALLSTPWPLRPAMKGLSNTKPTGKRCLKTWQLPFLTLRSLSGHSTFPYVCRRYEADDVIGTLAKEAEKQGFTVYMLPLTRISGNW
jgi:DNA polymerase-1